jgi:tRNA(Ile)-lysidine synthase
VRGLTAAAVPPIADLDAAVGAALDLRLQPVHTRPVAVAFSGGGDSLALLLAADAWAQRLGRDLVVLTVDHGLRAESAAWTAACAAVAVRLDRPFRALAWTGDKPKTGLPAAARAARHALLADAARAAGARVILIGHTADDVLEARRMRAAGSTVPDPREWSPSPAWPQGRGVFLARPLLGLSRRGIRDWLAARAETWIEDPANADLTYARARARHTAQGCASAPEPAAGEHAAHLARVCEADAAGVLAIPRAALQAAAPDFARRFVAAACLCAGGGARPPLRARTERLVARLRGEEKFVSSLAGARITADTSTARFAREPGEAARGGLAPLRLAAGKVGVWDGRFEVSAVRAVEVRAGRRGAPVAVAVGDDGESAALLSAFLGLERLLAACGAIDREPA